MLDKYEIILYNTGIISEEGIDMSVFSDRILFLMVNKGLSQKELARLTGITESAVSYYINGMRSPRGEVVKKIADALETTADYLLSFNEDNYERSKEMFKLQKDVSKLDTEQIKKADAMLRIMFPETFRE